jgi:NAD(P)-dependent dehydrogenase (short-subunit alcohol dehydrogenase family)
MEDFMSQHPALTAGRVAVITGGASGIGRAAAERLATFGMKLCLADVNAAALDEAAHALVGSTGRADDVIAVPTDVSRPEEVERLKDKVYERFGEVAVLMNNAASEGEGRLFSGHGTWRKIIDVNLWGVINGVQSFVPAMIAQGTPAAVINTGSKQGITTPPGNTAYNVSKAGVKVVTEALAHELRSAPGGKISAHLLIPGFTFTGLTRARGVTEKPPGAWTPEQVVDFMLPAMARGDFYILCPDNDVTREIDNRRIQWAAQDIIENRPALSRWHPDYEKAFASYMES